MTGIAVDALLAYTREFVVLRSVGLAGIVAALSVEVVVHMYPF